MKELRCEHKRRRYYAKGHCGPCYQSLYRKNHSEFLAKEKKRNKVWNQTHKERVNSRNRNYYSEKSIRFRKKAQRAKHLRVNYGLTIQDYNKMLKDQRGKCFICGNTPKTVRLNVDHDHKTGIVRGLLCWLCNKGLGFFRDKPERFDKAAEYLRRGNVIH